MLFAYNLNIFEFFIKNGRASRDMNRNLVSSPVSSRFDHDLQLQSPSAAQEDNFLDQLSTPLLMVLSLWILTELLTPHPTLYIPAPSLGL